MRRQQPCTTRPDGWSGEDFVLKLGDLSREIDHRQWEDVALLHEQRNQVEILRLTANDVIDETDRIRCQLQ
jgi:hypothetical protein